ncbi:MAG: DUF418 domain-containing protein [Bacillota bacterium]|nr:DUF418 domain-containing protein [Bacillota bacterium]
MKEMVSIQPTGVGERIRVLDFLRGFSLFGVLLVNMTLFRTTLFDYPRRMLDYADVTDQWISLIIQIFISGKFISVLSFLFGLGFFLFMARAGEKGLSIVPLYLRRLLSLFLFGLLHLVFIWNGDILHTYALAGLVLLWLRNKSLQSLQRWMVFFFVLSTVMITLAAWIEFWAQNMMGEELLQQQWLMGKMAFDTYAFGTFFEITRFRLFYELPNMAISLLYTVPFVLVLFLAGFYAGRRNVFRDIEDNLTFIRKVWTVSGLTGFLLTVFYVCIELEILLPGPALTIILLEVSKHISAILLSFFYISSLLLLLVSQRVSHNLLTPLANMGRMALTNYLLQSFICVSIFYGFGLGYMGKVSLLQVLLLTLGIYILQVLFSNYWLKRYSFGPMEWVWRRITYKKIEAKEPSLPFDL